MSLKRTSERDEIPLGGINLVTLKARAKRARDPEERAKDRNLFQLST
jgi:hypothetical protein